jgi:hypothetical protein
MVFLKATIKSIKTIEPFNEKLGLNMTSTPQTAEENL